LNAGNAKDLRPKVVTPISAPQSTILDDIVVNIACFLGNIMVIKW
jgi:hypothetical protein